MLEGRQKSQLRTAREREREQALLTEGVARDKLPCAAKAASYEVL